MPSSPYSPTGYNTSPPPDDGSTGASNKITWATIKAKLADPINNAVTTAFNAIVANAGASLVGFIHSLTGATARDLQARGRDFVSVKDFGAVGDGINDDTSAIQAALNVMVAGTDTTANPSIYFPYGTYLVTATLAPTNSASNFSLFGASKDGTVIKWGGAAGSPVFKFTNPRCIYLRDLSIYGKSTAKPSALVQFHRAAGGSIGAGTGFCGLFRVRLGDGTGDHTKSVLTSADGGQDSNNEQHVFEDVDSIGAATYGYHFSHSNSLLHKIVRGSVQSAGTASISNDCSGANNASFSCWDVAFSCTAGTHIMLLGNPRIGIELHGCCHENVGASDTHLVKMTANTFVSSTLKFYGGWYQMGDASTSPTVEWTGDSASILDLHGVTLFTPSNLTYSFPGAGRVNFFGGTSSTTTMTYAGEVTMLYTKEASGAPTYTQSGSGTLRLFRSSGTSQINVADIVTSGTTPSIAGLKVDGLIIFQHVSGTSVTKLLNGYAGQLVTVLANNGNSTLVHGTATDNFYLKGTANVTLSAGNTVTFRKLGTAIGVDVWMETGRNF